MCTWPRQWISKAEAARIIGIDRKDFDRETAGLLVAHVISTYFYLHYDRQAVEMLAAEIAIDAREAGE